MAGPFENQAGSFQFGEFVLDFAARCLYRTGQRVHLTRKPLETLAFLVQNRGRIVSKEDLLHAVWGGVREPSTVEHAVLDLRKALGDDKDRPLFIETIPRQGYCFVAEVRTDSGPEEIRAKSAGASLRERVGRRQTLFWTAGAVLTVALAGAALFLRTNSGGPPVRINFERDRVTAWDARGNRVWEDVFGENVTVPPPDQVSQPVRFADLDGDGRPEALVTVSFAEEGQLGSHPEALLCFSSQGKLRWKYMPEMTLTFGGRSYTGPWHFTTDLLILPAGNAKHVWLAMSHHTWWPGFLTKILPDGSATVQFISAGVISGLRQAKNASGDFVLAGGVNNEYKAATMAVLKTDQPPAVSPQSPDSVYRCDGCPTGMPVRYYLFPRSEINVALGLPYNRVVSVPVYQDVYQAFVSEGRLGVVTMYDFSKNLDIQAASVGDGYREAHESLEAEGKIRHKWADCPERTSPRQVRIWEPDAGWRTVAVSWITPPD